MPAITNAKGGTSPPGAGAKRRARPRAKAKGPAVERKGIEVRGRGKPTDSLYTATPVPSDGTPPLWVTFDPPSGQSSLHDSMTMADRRPILVLAASMGGLLALRRAVDELIAGLAPELRNEESRSS